MDFKAPCHTGGCSEASHLILSANYRKSLVSRLKATEGKGKQTMQDRGGKFERTELFGEVGKSE